jgi:hypothetical protein
MDDDSKFYALLGRALMEPEFRARVLDTGRQAAALKEVGIEADGAALGQLNDSIKAIDQLASSFGPIKAVT